MLRSRTLALGLTGLLLSAGSLLAQQKEPYSEPRATNPTQTSRETATQGSGAATSNAAQQNTAPANPTPSAGGAAATTTDRNAPSNTQRDARDQATQDRNDNSADSQRANADRQDNQANRDQADRNQGTRQDNHADKNDETYRDDNSQNHARDQRQADQGQQGASRIDPQQPALGVWITNGPELRVLGTPANSPAAQIGIQVGDRILSVGGHQFSSSHDLIRGLGEMNTDEDVEVEYMRNGQRYASTVQLGTRSDVFGQQQLAQNGSRGMSQGQPYTVMRPMTGNNNEVQQLQAEVQALKQQVQQLRQEMHHLKADGDRADNTHNPADNRQSRFNEGPPAPPENLNREGADKAPAARDNNATDRNRADADQQNRAKPNRNRNADSARDTTLPPPEIPGDSVPAVPESAQPQD